MPYYLWHALCKLCANLVFESKALWWKPMVILAPRGERISHCARGTVGWFHAAASGKGARRVRTKVLTHALAGHNGRPSEREYGCLTHETGLARLGGKGREVTACKKWQGKLHPCFSQKKMVEIQLRYNCCYKYESIGGVLCLNSLLSVAGNDKTSGWFGHLFRVSVQQRLAETWNANVNLCHKPYIYLHFTIMLLIYS